MHMPAATVVPMSLMANLPSCGISFTGSMTMGLEGVTMIMAASPALMKAGFSLDGARLTTVDDAEAELRAEFARRSA